MEWGADLQVAALDARLRELLGEATEVSVSLMLGIELDNEGHAKPNADPRVDAVTITADGAEILYLSRRGQDERGGLMRLDRLADKLPVIRKIVAAIIESATTAREAQEADFVSASEAIANLLPNLVVRIERFLPKGVEITGSKPGDVAGQSRLFAVSKGNRSEDIAEAVTAYLPRVLDDLVGGLTSALSGELERLQYLGPIRSLPPRHIAFAEQGDADWYAGGAYAWDLVRHNDKVRAAVNTWLGSDKLKTPYKLTVRSLVALDQVQSPLDAALEDLSADAFGIEVTSDWDREGENNYPYAVIKDTAATAGRLTLKIEESDADRIRELVLVDKRSNTVVSHRDVGIGISQVLPVLVMAYGSSGKLIAIEQPEIHLHPALQAELGDVFIESALGERQNTFILETHSEHLILRLLRRVREKKLRADDVCVLFVEPATGGSRVKQLEIDDDGDFIDEWPGGFFEESFHEKFAGR